MNAIANLIANIDSKVTAGNTLPGMVPLLLLSLFILSIVGASILGWLAIGIAKYGGYPLPLRAERHSAPPWGVIDLLLISFGWFITQVLAGTWMRRAGWIEVGGNSESVSLFVMAVIQTLSMIAMCVGAIWLLVWFRSKSQYCGWSIRYLGYDILLGAAVFVLIAPALWSLMAAATLLTEVKYDHPLIKAIEGDPSNLWSAIWVAVIVAPFFEEFGFRVLLQGFLQSLAEKSTQPKLLIAIMGRGRLPRSNQNNIEPSKSFDSMANANRVELTTTAQSRVEDTASSNPYIAPSNDQRLGSTQTQSAVQADEAAAAPKLWPILVSGTLFGLAHFDYGVSWIPLVFFGFVLGWLYQRTNRIWPSLVAHMFCNFIGVAGITLQVLYGNPNG